MTLSRRLLKHALFVASALSLVISVQARADELIVSAAASLTNAFRAVSIGDDMSFFPMNELLGRIIWCQRHGFDGFGWVK